jgi:hypothetical protein
MLMYLVEMEYWMSDRDPHTNARLRFKFTATGRRWILFVPVRTYRTIGVWWRSPLKKNPEAVITKSVPAQVSCMNIYCFWVRIGSDPIRARTYTWERLVNGLKVFLFTYYGTSSRLVVLLCTPTWKRALNFEVRSNYVLEERLGCDLEHVMCPFSFASIPAPPDLDG